MRPLPKRTTASTLEMAFRGLTSARRITTAVAGPTGPIADRATNTFSGQPPPQVQLRQLGFESAAPGLGASWVTAVAGPQLTNSLRLAQCSAPKSVSIVVKPSSLR